MKQTLLNARRCSNLNMSSDQSSKDTTKSISKIKIDKQKATTSEPILLFLHEPHNIAALSSLKKIQQSAADSGAEEMSLEEICASIKEINEIKQKKIESNNAKSCS